MIETVPAIPAGWLTTAQVASRERVTTRQVRRWVQSGLRAVWVGAGRNSYLAIDPAALAKFERGTPGAPAGNRNAAKNSDAQDAANSSTPKVSRKKSRKH